jgi:hypothetical protein
VCGSNGAVVVPYLPLYQHFLIGFGVCKRLLGSDDSNSPAAAGGNGLRGNKLQITWCAWHRLGYLGDPQVASFFAGLRR